MSMEVEAAAMPADASEKDPEFEDEETKPRLPLELLAAVMDRLLVTRKKRTLLELLLANRACYLLGLPILLRTIVILGAAEDAEKLLAFSKDSLKTDKFRHIRSLQLNGTTGAGLDVLRACAPFLEKLKVEMTVDAYAFAIFSVLSNRAVKSWNLRHLEVTFLSDSVKMLGSSASRSGNKLTLPASVRFVRVRYALVADGRPFLDLLNSAPGLEEWDLNGFYDLNLKIPFYPRLVERLRRVEIIRNLQLEELSSTPYVALKELVVGLGVDRQRLWAVVSRLNLETLVFEYAATSDLLWATLPAGLKMLTIKGALLSLPPISFTKVGTMLASFPELRVKIIRAPHYGSASWVAAEDEIKFWKSLENATVEM